MRFFRTKGSTINSAHSARLAASALLIAAETLLNESLDFLATEDTDVNRREAYLTFLMLDRIREVTQ